MRRRTLATLTAVLALTVACATTQKLLITVDKSVAVAVYAVDDAEWNAYNSHEIDVTEHAILNAKIVKALDDVGRVTDALEVAPTTVPKNLPELLTDLVELQNATNSLNPVVPTLSSKIGNALSSAIQLLNKLVGGAQ